MDAISDLPMPHDIDADYSPQYVKLARVLREKIESSHYQPGATERGLLEQFATGDEHKHTDPREDRDQ